MFRTFLGRQKESRNSAIVFHYIYGMLVRHASHGLRILVSKVPEIRRYPSNKLSWLNQGQQLQVSLPGVFYLCNILPTSAVSERPRRIHCSAAVLSHHRPGTPCSTTGDNDTIAEDVMTISSSVYQARAPFSQWLHVPWFGIGTTRGSHDCLSRGVADQPSSRRMPAREKRFLENLELCREYVHRR